MNLKLHVLFLSIFVLAGCQKEADQFKQPVDRSIGTEGVINDEFMGIPLIVYADEEKKMMTAFSRVKAGEALEFDLRNGSFPDMITDQKGSTWNVFGDGVSEDNKGERLDGVSFLVGYWFVFPAFFDEVYLFNGEKINGGGENKLNDIEWSVNTRYLAYGSFQDGIPSIDNPLFYIDANKALIDDSFYKDFDDNELVTVICYDGIIKIYPHQILDYHEVVNDNIGGLSYSLSYCPLTGTSRIWNREIEGNLNEFGVSGLLYNNNLILYDRLTESYWSQVLERSIYGKFKNSDIEKLDCFEMKFVDAKILDGEINILKSNTGFNYQYNEQLYDDYKENDGVYYPLATSNNFIHPKERVLGIIVGDKVKVYRFSDF